MYFDVMAALSFTCADHDTETIVQGAIADETQRNAHDLVKQDHTTPVLLSHLGIIIDPSNTDEPSTAATVGAAVAGDPVIRCLSRAFSDIEEAGLTHAGLCADAIRLATFARVLSIRKRAAVRPDFTPPTPPRTKAGLVTWRLRRVIAFINAHLDGPVRLADMAAAAGLSRMHFAAQFQLATGVRPHVYLLRRRIERAQELMLETTEPLVQIAHCVGFQTQAHFTTVFRRFVGVTPYQWRAAKRATASAGRQHGAENLRRGAVALAGNDINLSRSAGSHALPEQGSTAKYGHARPMNRPGDAIRSSSSATIHRD